MQIGTRDKLIIPKKLIRIAGCDVSSSSPTLTTQGSNLRNFFEYFNFKHFPLNLDLADGWLYSTLKPRKRRDMKKGRHFVFGSEDKIF
jgi:hypothetical protein